MSLEPENEKDEIDIALDPLDPGPPPDGGLTAWMQVVVMFFGTWNSWGIVNIFGVYQEYYEETLLSDIPSGTISWIGTLGGCLIYFGAVFVGPLIDLGYVKHMVLISAILQSFSFMMLSLCTEYYQIVLTQGILSGLASSMAFLCGVSSVGTWFSKRRSMAVGFGATGSAFGGVVYSIASRNLIRLVGFAWSARIIGFIALATQLCAFFCCKRRLPPRKTGTFFDFGAFSEVRMLSLATSLLAGNAGTYIFYFYAQSYGLNQVKNVNTQLMLYTTAIMNSGSVPGRVIPNFIAGYMGPVTVYAICLGATALFLWFWLLAKSMAGMLVVSWLVGFSSGPVVSLPAPAVATFTLDLGKLGTRLAFIYVHAGVGMLIGPPLAGIMIRNHAWKYGIIYAGSLCTLGTVLAVFCRQYCTKGRIWGKA